MFTDFIFNALEGIIVGIISLPFIFVVRELGHLLCGRLSGYQFVSLRLLFFQWTKGEDGQIKFSRVNSLFELLVGSLFGIDGKCLMIPTGEEKDFRYQLYNLGGGLANVILGLILMVPIFFSGHTFSRWLFIAGIVSIFIAAINLIPIAFGGSPNDGRNVLEARKSEDAKHAFYCVIQANGMMALGKRLSDFDEDFFNMSESADVNNFLVTQFILFHAAHLEEKGNYKESYQKLLLLEKAELPSSYKAEVLLALLFNELVYQGNDESLERAKERWSLHKNDKKILEIVEEKTPALMIPYAAKIAFIDSDFKKARALLSEAKKLIPLLYNFGMEQLANQMIEQLENRLPKVVPRESSLEETSVKESPVEETPVEETSVEETPMEETPVEEVPKITPEVIQEEKLESIQMETLEEVQEDKPESIQMEALEKIQEEKPEEIQEEPEPKSITGLFETTREEAPSVTPTITPTVTPTITPTIRFEDDKEETEEVSEEQKKKSYEDIMEQLKKRR